MEAESRTCSSCGAPASGAFCSRCGAALSPARRRIGSQGPWIVSALALVVATAALLVALSNRYDRDFSQVAVDSSPDRPLAAGLAPPTEGPPDLSSMTPREAADRLFNRIMAASEQRNLDEARRFVPMALAAYRRVGELDNDARYHVALIDLVADDIPAAVNEIKRIRATNPSHLLAFMIEHQIAQRNGDKNLASSANRGFLAAYQQELAAGRVEYQDHQNMIERFHSAAKAGTSVK